MESKHSDSLPQVLQSLPEELRVIPTPRPAIYRVHILLPCGDWRRVGRLHLRGEGTFYCRRNIERHLLRSADAWGISRLVLELPIMILAHSVYI